MFEKEDLDIVLVPSGFLVIIVYSIIVSCRDSNDHHSTRRDWVKRIMQGDNKDTNLAVISSSITAAYSLCGACLIIFPIAWLANSSSYVFQGELVYGNTSPLLITFKFGSLIACFLLAMACFARSAKHFNQAYYLISSQNRNIKASDVEAAIRAVIGGDHFHSLGMRSLKCAGTLLLWFFGPIPMFLSSVALVIFLHDNYTGRLYVHNRVNFQIQSFQKLGFSESEILCALHEDNLIGRGPSGEVYKVVLTNGKVIAVKKPRRGRVNECENNNFEKGMVQDDGFIAAGVDTLGRIMHMNIMKPRYCCTTSQLLVYDYMPNGSLGDFLHNKKAGLLNWPTRFKIALGAAEGISYLHHDCSPSIVHRNVKSNNILLDGDFRARVVDFGTTNGIDASGRGPVIAGACSYIAPEFPHAHGLNRKSDIYNFGVVMLELVLGNFQLNRNQGKMTW